MDKNPETETLTPKDLFRELLNRYGFMRDPDGHNHCGGCFANYLNTIMPDHRDWVENDSHPTGESIENAPSTVRVREGWYARCEGVRSDSFSKEDQCPHSTSIFVAHDGSQVKVIYQKGDNDK